MAKIQILHNPRCSKSRQTLELLKSNDIEPEIVEYLKQPLDQKQIQSLLKKLGLKPSEFMRKSEFAKLGLKPDHTEEGIIRQMVSNPILIERPVVVNGNKAKIGRPPESVLDII